MYCTKSLSPIQNQPRRNCPFPHPIPRKNKSGNPFRLSRFIPCLFLTRPVFCLFFPMFRPPFSEHVRTLLLARLILPLTAGSISISPRILPSQKFYLSHLFISFLSLPFDECTYNIMHPEPYSLLDRIGQSPLSVPRAN